MRVDLFDYHLPEELIAKEPARPRDSARLLDLSEESLADRGVLDLPSLLQPGDCLVFNDTKVIPARLKGKRGEAGIELTLHKRESDRDWLAFARPAKKLKPGNQIDFGGDFSAEVLEKHEGGEVLICFDRGGEALRDALERFGSMPLPPYIRRKGDENAEDRKDYQTIFAEKEGAVAAPTAGLHFTDRLIEALKERGVRFANVTLHVGAGTFLPVKVDDTDDHQMHSEWGEISAETAALLNETRATGGRIVSIGTTSLRILETATGEDVIIPAFQGDTSLFITPGYRFKAIDMLLTNFHLPKSTLLMLVSAFAGRERMLSAYEHAVDAGYRFFSYGDACLLKRTGL